MIQNIVIRNGILMFLGFTGFFLIMHALNLSQHYDLRIFNGVIHLTLITVAIRQYLKQHREDINYVATVSIGMATSMIGVTAFAIFQLIHLAVNTSFMQYLQENVPYVGQYLTPFTAALSIFMEGIAISLIGSYVITRLIEAMSSRRLRSGGPVTIRR